MKNFLNEGNQIRNFISSSGSGTVINYDSCSDFLTNFGSGSGSTCQKVTVPTVPVPQHCLFLTIDTFTSVFKDNKLLRCKRTVDFKGFLFSCLLIKRIQNQIQIWI
jgi:hypothetical protein